MNFKNTEQKKSYNLCNIENYNSSINCNLSDILNKYTLIIFDYMKLISEQINIKHQKYYHFIFMRGLDTITNVFKMLLFLTKNIDLTYFHSQKAFYFYVEFIEQISNDKNTFLQLGSREACIFVYKKTIFEINNEHRKNIDSIQANEQIMLSLLDKYINIYKNMCFFFIQNIYLHENNKTTQIHDFCDKLQSLSNELNRHYSEEFLDSINLLVHSLVDMSISINYIFQTLYLFIKKITSVKTNIHDKFYINMKNKLSSEDFFDKINQFDPKLFVSWIVK